MQVGAAFPMQEIGTDPGAIRAFAQAADELGYAHLIGVEHVLGVDPASHPGYEPIKNVQPIYLSTYAFHELFVLLGYIAAITERIELFTHILILPQRQTALVAKQAAEVDILSRGRLRLGVAVGHVNFEYEGLGADFTTRGSRIEEQIELLRLLWTQEKVDFSGKYHRLNGVGINPLPIQRPIPIWIGGWSERVVRRAARLADGIVLPADTAQVLRYVQEAGRDPSRFGMTANLPIGSVEPTRAVSQAKEQMARGITHLNVVTQRAGLKSVDEHIEALRRFKAAYGADSSRGARSASSLA